MNDILAFVQRGAQKMTPAQMAEFEHQLPLLMAKMNEVDSPFQPHLQEQAQFLIWFVEDCLDGEYQPNNFIALTEAIFALMYLDQGVDIIPDSLPEIGYADDSAIVRAVLISHREEFKRFSELHGVKLHLPSFDA